MAEPLKETNITNLPNNEAVASVFDQGDTFREQLTPMMKQYWDIKQKHRDILVFYRMGDFYEMFFDDAVKASEILDIALTKRGTVQDEDIPMCGVPYHSCQTYMSKLIRSGFKVAICEQVETPEQAKQRGGSGTLVKRAVTRIVTSGTLTEDNLLSARRNNYLCSIAFSKGDCSIAWVDVSTGNMQVQTSDKSNIISALQRLNPSEVITPQTQASWVRDMSGFEFEVLTPMPDSRFDPKNSLERIKETYKVKAIDHMGAMTDSDIGALGVLIDYIGLTQKGKMPRLSMPQKTTDNGLMVIDQATHRNLELTSTLRNERKGSLLDTIDRCVTAQGARELSNRLASPLTDDQKINTRLDQVNWFYDRPQALKTSLEILRQCPDLERALSRLSLGRAGPRDMKMIMVGCEHALSLKNMLHAVIDDNKNLDTHTPDALLSDIKSLSTPDIQELIDELNLALKDDVPFLARDGGFIRNGYSSALDEFVSLRDGSKRIIASLQKDYIEKATLPSLKIKYNKVLGYFIEVTSKYADQAYNYYEGDNPDNKFFIHRQTLANCMRFTTPELTNLAKKIAESDFRAVATELEIFESLTEKIMQCADSISQLSRSIARIDCHSALAGLAQDNHYVRPTVDNSLTFDIKAGRHPVVEQALKKQNDDKEFISNNCTFSEGQRLWLLTGPNMSGKSTFLRQNALIAVMAQIGSFVPAMEAHIGIIDRLFSRVGAADDLARGRSTFMVEMVETATILNQATKHSLVILDEIGRGTATFDGLSIAWGTIEHLHDINGSRGLFATHYHELTVLSEHLRELECYSVAIREWKNDIVFLHQVVQGSADHSYGIHVARLAGLPKVVIKRAQDILQRIRKGEVGQNVSVMADHLPLFDTLQAQIDPTEQITENQRAIINRIETLDPDHLTPSVALDILYELKKKS